MTGTPPRRAPTPGAAPDLTRLEDEIRASRARLDGTVDALRDRMARLAPRTLPRTLMERTMKHTYSPIDRDPYGEPTRNVERHQPRRSSSVMGSVSSNPIPLALVGIGLGWLALSSTGYDRRIARSGPVRAVRHRAEDAADYARDTLASATDSVRHAASSAYESASDAVSDAYDSASDAVSGAYESASNAVGGASDRVSNHLPPAPRGGLHVGERMHGVTSSVWEMVEDHPVVAGALGIALGAAIGAALPGTRYENRWVGEYADEAGERAKTLALDALDRGTRAAQATAQATVEAAKEEVTEAAASITGAAREEVKKPA